VRIALCTARGTLRCCCGDGVASRGDCSAGRFTARDLCAPRGTRTQEPEQLTAAGLLALDARAPEIDGDAWMHEVGVEADKPNKPPIDDRDSDDDSDDNGNDGNGTMDF
jgi:hypothetical protein